jgi:hypothetical protein
VDIREEESGIGDDSPDAEFYRGAPEEEPSWEAIWNAPDYSLLIKTRQSLRAKEYTTKINSVLKAATFASIQAGDLPDAAAILHYGPAWSNAMGVMADKDKRVAGAIDMLTSPSSPLVMALVTTITLAAQILRNHEKQIKEIPNARKRAKAEKKARAAGAKLAPPRFKMRIWKWEIPVRFQPRVKLSTLFSGFRAQTQAPELLTMAVFSDEDLLKALEKQGIRLVRNEHP